MDVAITIDDELFEEEEYANKTYAIDWENKRIIGHVDNKEALMQFIHKAIITERNEYKAIYSTEYGSEIANTVMGDPPPDDYIYAVIPSLIKDCLLVDDRIVDVYDFSITLEDNVLNIEFLVDTIYGNGLFVQEVIDNV